jgi:hypothetical protein
VWTGLCLCAFGCVCVYWVFFVWIRLCSCGL